MSNAVLRGFDPLKTAVVMAEDVPEAAAAEQDGARAGSATLLADRGEALAIRATGPGTLIIADTWYPGWTAEVDGVEAPIWRANVWQRAIPVPAGEHEVHLQFALPKLRESRLIQGLGIGLWVMATGVGLCLGSRRRASNC